MIKKVILWILIGGLLSCNENSKKKSVFNKADFTEHYIDDIKGTLLLTPKFEKITSVKFPYLFPDTDSTSVLRRVVDNLESDRKEYVLYFNEQDKNDFILIYNSEYVNFFKSDANKFLGLMESYMLSSYGQGNYTRLEEKFSQSERSKYLKIKYKIAGLFKETYLTQYVVTSKATTFAVFEIRTAKKDYEDLIRRINYIVN